MKCRNIITLATLGILALCLPGTRDSVGQDKTETKSRQAWTLDEAVSQLSLNPRDPYLQYVVMQLARRENPEKVDEIVDRIGSRNGTFRGRREGVDLFNIFSGALAVQESLQLDTMRGRDQNRAFRNLQEGGNGLGGEPEAKQPANNALVDINTIQGPTIKSHPWKEMLAGRKPAISPLARSVPDDFYFVGFSSLNKLAEIMEAGDLWGTQLFAQAHREAVSQEFGERIKRQLAIKTDPLSRPFYDLVVSEVAVTGSDLFVREGTDVTLLFKLKQPDVFKQRMDGYLAEAEKLPGAKRTTGKILGVEFVHVETPERQVYVYSADPSPDLHVRSNSRVALERVLAAIQGKSADGKPVARLGESTEFQFIRTMFVTGASEEDGLVYLSDPFIRKQVGPQLKLTERRRMLCYNHLRMIGHAAMMYRTEFGKIPASLAELAELAQAQCTPGQFGEGLLVCPDGGKYTLSADGTTGVCSHHGHAHELTPCCEIPLSKVTHDEAQEYEAFLESYNQYWRTYFDPIALRVQATPKRYRLETVVLPLIDNSIYTGLSQAMQGPPAPLETLPIPKKNIASVVYQFDKKQLLKDQLNEESVRGLNEELRRSLNLPADAKLPDVEKFVERGMGSQVGFHIYDSVQSFDLNYSEFLGEVFGSFNGSRSLREENLALAVLVTAINSPVYVSLNVQDPKVVDEFLNDLDALLAARARAGGDWGWFRVNYDFYKLPASETGSDTRGYALSFGPLKWRFFYARIGNGLYIASKKFILDDLRAAEAERAAAVAAGKKPDPGPTAHAMIRIRPNHWNLILPDYQLGWAENNRQACLGNLGPLSSVARAFTASTDKPQPDPAARSAEICRHADELHAAHFFCPEGGHYVLAPDGKTMTCSIHGTQLAPKQAAAPDPQGDLNKLWSQLNAITAELTFLEDGLHAVLTLDRK